MKFAAFVLIIVLVTSVVVWRVASQSQPGSSQREAIDPLERARSDVERVGWHIVAVPDEGDASGYLFTIGLWRTWQHPEILIFAPQSDPRGMVGRLEAVVKQIEEGADFSKEQDVPGAFGKHPGAVRKVLPVWRPSVLGLAAAFYESFDVPVLQLFWPDGKGGLPWQGVFDANLFHFQPVLFQDNLILANLGRLEIERRLAEEGGDILDAALGELLLPVDDQLLETWRWLVGDEAVALKATIFGDLLVKSPDGIHWLDTGAGTLDQLPVDESQWMDILMVRPALFLRPSLILELREKGFRPGSGEVYDWIQEPMLGGPETAANIQTTTLAVHLSSTGRVAQGLTEGGPPTENDDDGVTYDVVINAEEQYSIWPLGRDLPEGWKTTGFSGSRDECFEHISSVWEDLRPKSLRDGETSPDS